MKFNYLIKVTPLLSTLFLIIFLSINNQKQYTKLKVLIWNTPSLQLGTYIAISTSTGFILSYLITTKLSLLNQTTKNESLRYKYEDKNEENSDYIETNNNTFYDNTLIERDVKDPSPTINANFRIIGKKERSSINYKNTRSDVAAEYVKQYDDQNDSNEMMNEVNSISNDWNDESYSIW